MEEFFDDYTGSYAYLIMPQDSCRKSTSEVEAFIKNQNKGDIAILFSEENYVISYNSIKIIPVTTNNSVMLMNNFNLLFNTKEIDVMV